MVARSRREELVSLSAGEEVFSTPHKFVPADRTAIDDPITVFGTNDYDSKIPEHLMYWSLVEASQAHS
jgi:hypothetical protein